MRISDGTVDLVYENIVDFKIKCDGNTKSFRDIAKDIGVSVTTVSNAVTVLEERGKLQVIRENGRAKFVIVIGGKWTKDDPRASLVHDQGWRPDGSLDAEPPLLSN